MAQQRTFAHRGNEVVAITGCLAERRELADIRDDKNKYT